MNQEQFDFDKQQADHSDPRVIAIAFLTEHGARYSARTKRADEKIVILHSPHDANPRDDERPDWRADYFVLEADAMVRSWERVLYEGLGRDA